MSIVTSIYNMKPMQNLLVALQKEKPIAVKVGGEYYKTTTTSLKTLQKHFPPFIGLLVGGGYIYNINKSKKIPEERKLPLTINSIFTSAVGIIGGYYFNPKVDSFADTLTKRVVEALNNDHIKNSENLKNVTDAMKEAEKVKLKDTIKMFKSGIKAAVPVIIFALTLRFFAPVFATPISDKLTKYLIKKGFIKDPAEKNKTIPPPKAEDIYVPSVLPAAGMSSSRFLGNSQLSLQGNSNLDQTFNSFLQKVNYLS